MPAWLGAPKTVPCCPSPLPGAGCVLSASETLGWDPHPRGGEESGQTLHDPRVDDSWSIHPLLHNENVNPNLRDSISSFCGQDKAELASLWQRFREAPPGVWAGGEEGPSAPPCSRGGGRAGRPGSSCVCGGPEAGTAGLGAGGEVRPDFANRTDETSCGTRALPIPGQRGLGLCPGFLLRRSSSAGAGDTAVCPPLAGQTPFCAGRVFLTPQAKGTLQGGVCSSPFLEAAKLTGHTEGSMLAAVTASSEAAWHSGAQESDSDVRVHSAAVVSGAQESDSDVFTALPWSQARRKVIQTCVFTALPWSQARRKVIQTCVFTALPWSQARRKVIQTCVFTALPWSQARRKVIQTCVFTALPWSQARRKVIQTCVFTALPWSQARRKVIQTCVFTALP
ncbi:hypothetical protein ABFV05_007174 [Capra hircus]